MIVQQFPSATRPSQAVIALIRSHEHGLYHGVSTYFYPDQNKLEALWNALSAEFQVVSTDHSSGIYKGILNIPSTTHGKDTAVVFAEIERHDGVNITIYSDTEGKYADVLERIKEEFAAKPEPPEDNDQIQITIWHSTPMGPKNFHRWVSFPKWEDMKNNYSGAISADLDKFMVKQPTQSSGMVVWTGPPGTGKTTAIRALARQWDPWCHTHIIADPEVMLNDMTYLYQVLFSGGTGPSLIILEDSGELIATDARRSGGQAVSRLLNVTDGILGQGMEAYFLITTNEAIDSLHGAVTRPGRCLPHGNLDFGKLSAAESNEWLKAKALDAVVDEPTSLADLYHKLTLSE